MRSCDSRLTACRRPVRLWGGGAFREYSPGFQLDAFRRCSAYVPAGRHGTFQRQHIVDIAFDRWMKAPQFGQGQVGKVAAALLAGPNRQRHRSEEHTSELQSLMRTSYAVFCLKKKTLQL